MYDSRCVEMKGVVGLELLRGKGQRIGTRTESWISCRDRVGEEESQSRAVVRGDTAPGMVEDKSRSSIIGELGSLTRKI